MATFFQIKTKGDMYPEIIEIRIDDIKGDYIDYAIESIKELKKIRLKIKLKVFVLSKEENINGNSSSKLCRLDLLWSYNS